MQRHITLLLMLSIVFVGIPSDGRAQCGSCRYGVDLVTNGDFESGNAGFTTSLNYSPGPIFFCPLCDENTYAIGANATLYHSGFSGSDHTNPPTGDFFIANGPGQAGALVWCQSFSVTPNTDYTFTFWARDVTNNSNPHPMALLQPTFNGIAANDTLEANGGWEEFSMVWNSGSNTFLDLCLVNQQSLTGGNDFGLDDISLTACYDYHLSQPAFAGDDTSICSGEVLQLGQQSISGYMYTWDNSTGLSSTSASNPTVSISNNGIDPISYTYIVSRDSAGVGCIDQDTVVVTILPTPPFELGPDVSICPGEFATLDAGDTWNQVQWSTSETSQSIVVGVGIYSATVDYGGCSMTDQLEVIEIELPDINLGPDQNICSTTTLQLDAGVNGTWSDGSVSPTLEVNGSGEYSFIYEEGNCFVFDTVTISVTEMPVLLLPADTSFCEGTEIILDAGAPGLWNTGDISSTLEVTSGGTYDIVVQNGPCTATAATQVDMNALPDVFLGDDISICEEDSVELNAFSISNVSYLWSTGDSTGSIYSSGAGDYSVTVTNACGTASDELSIDTYPCSWALYIPSSFTPNDDTFNESWSVQGYNVSNLSIIVYNRFGDAIFKAKDLGIPWYPSTGIYDDVYNYRIEATTFDGDNVVQTGHIYLLR